MYDNINCQYVHGKLNCLLRTDVQETILRLAKATDLHAEDSMQYTESNVTNDKDFILAEVKQHCKVCQMEINHKTQ